MHFALLSQVHADALLDFERENRGYFERFIEARAARLYSPSGIRDHIDELIRETLAGTASPWLLLDGVDVVARANLRQLDPATASAEIGYRVSAAHAGRGIATRCVAHLIETAEQRFGIRLLRAAVLANNPASARVLEKYGFRSTACLPSPVAIGGELLEGSLYELDRRKTGAPAPQDL